MKYAAGTHTCLLRQLSLRQFVVFPCHSDILTTVPTECECPADEYSDEYDCKHKVAVAVVGGPVVLGAAVAYTSREEPPLRADGGVVEASDEESQEEEQCDCSESSDFPCWGCFRDGRKELLEREKRLNRCSGSLPKILLSVDFQR